MLIKNNIDKYIIFLLVTAFITGCASGNSTGNKEKHFLWEVNSAQGKVYLLGSIHLAKEDFYPLPAVIDSAFENSSVLGVEFNVKDVNPYKMMKAALYQDTGSLKNNVKPEAYEKFRQMFDKHKVPEVQFNRYKPWFATMMLLNLELVKSGYKQEYGIDVHFLGKAKEENKEIAELESFEEQIELLDKDLAQYQDQFLDYSLHDFESTQAQIDSMFAAWKTGDVKMMERLTTDEIDKYPEYKPISELVINKRNERMLNKIRNYLQSGKTYFIVVGAGHLIGEKGLLNLLKKDGYSVEQK